MQILKHELRRAAFEKRAAELKEVGAERRQALLAEIEKDIERELRRRWTTIEPDTLLH